MSRRPITFAAALALLLSLSLSAMAYPSPDTVLVAGWDRDAKTLYYDTLGVEEAEGETLDLECVSTDGEVDEDVSVDGVALTDETETCELTSVVIPDGRQLNHGAVVSAFANALVDLGHGKGCLMRHIARSNWGKESDEGDSEEVTLEAFLADCLHGPDESVEDTESSDTDTEDGGQPGWARKLGPNDDWKPGDGKPPWAGGPKR